MLMRYADEYSHEKHQMIKHDQGRRRAAEDKGSTVCLVNRGYGSLSSG